jgi:2-C-methyl-D-erythritol 2,4-cyclodiphosphate synthase
MLGAAALRDIGYYFPDTDQSFKNIDSKLLLADVKALVEKAGYEVGNVDITIAAQAPKLSPHIEAMRECVARCLAVDIDQVCVKATTTEHLGFTGRKEGIAAFATVLLVAKI